MKNFYKWVSIALLILVAVFFMRNRDAFTSPGTMVQLASSHVPTQEDVDFYKYVYPKQVRHDLIDLTGGDPGPISVPMPQLWM
jgi:hypothetical protein